MEIQKFFDFSYIRNYIKIESSNFSIYLKELYYDLKEYDQNQVELGISKSTFMDYFKLPYIINNKLYRIFDKENTGYIDFNSFNNKMNNLFLGEFFKTSKIIFNIYDFDNDGKILKEDVRLILSFLPLKKSYNISEFKLQLKSLEEIDKILNESFGINNNELDYEEFLNVIEKIRSDIFIHLLCYIYKKKPFEDKTITLIQNSKKKIDHAHPILEAKKINITSKNEIKQKPINLYYKRTKIEDNERITTFPDDKETKSIFSFNDSLSNYNGIGDNIITFLNLLY